MSMLISAVLATAKTVRKGKTVPTGKSGMPSRTTVRSTPVSLSLPRVICSVVSTVTTAIATSM